MRGTLTTVAGQLITQSISIASILIMSRILSPAEIGVYALLASLLAFVDIFKDLGLSTATVQRRDINDLQSTGIFWTNISVALVAIGVLTAVSQPISAIFETTVLIELIPVASIAILLGALSAQHQALLRREMRYGTIVLTDVIAKTVALVSAVYCGLNGFGVWSLVASQLLASAAFVAATWGVSRWRPFAPSASALKAATGFFGYGSGVTFTAFLSYVLRNADNLIVGKFLGSELLGHYSRSYSLLLFPLGLLTQPFTTIALPTLSQLQNEPSRYRNYYLKMTAIVAHVSMPMIAFMAGMAEEIVALALGDRWTEAAVTFKLLALAALWTPYGATTGWVYLSLGRTREMVLWTGIMTPITIVGFLFGTQWGLQGVAAAYSFVITAQLVPQFWFALRNTSISLTDALQCCAHPLLVSATIFSGLLVLKLGLGSGDAYVALLVGATWSAGVWTISTYLRPSMRVHAIEATSVIRQIFESSRK